MLKSLSIAAMTIACLASVAQAEEKPPIKIAVVNDQGGVYMEAGGPGSGVAARLAAEAFGGEVLGRKIEVMVLDHQNKPDIAASLTRKLIDVDKVDLLADGASSAAGLAMNEVAKAAKKIFVVSGPAATNFTGAACSPTTFHFNYDTYALANGTGKAIVKQGGNTWFFLTADYAFGHSLEADASTVVKANGGTVAGSVRHPLSASDFSSFLLQAQSSKAQILAMANAGGDFTNAMKSAREFGINKTMKIAGLLVFINDIHSLGLANTAGLQLADSWYWNQDDASRAFAKRFFEKYKRMPSSLQAADYSATTTYLKAVQAAGTTDGEKVMATLKSMKIDDFYNKGSIRKDGRMIHDMYLFEVKTPKESTTPWDYLKLVAKVPGDQAFTTPAESKCSLMK